MNKRKIINIIFPVFLILIFGIVFSNINNSSVSFEDFSKLTGTVMKYDDNTVTIQDINSAIYTFNVDSIDFDIGDSITIQYAGVIDKNSNNQSCEVIYYMVVDKETDENGIPTSWLDNGIFSNYYTLAYNKLKTMSLDEKIGQLLLVRYPDSNQVEDLKKYKFAGFVFYEKDFRNKTKSEVIQMIKTLQNNSDIPLLTAVDEEGGNVVRVSSNPNLVSEKFKSPSELYDLGGFAKIKQDTIYKSDILHSLGLNVNLAPVVDVSTNPSDYMYERTLKQDTALTSTYAKTVIEASKGTGVSYTLKHFPGYSSNLDTHTGVSTDTRSYEEILQNDLPPFEAGIEAGAEDVLVGHNVVNSIDSTNPASLSIDVHNLLRNELGFTGVIIIDDIEMSALSNIDEASVQALLAGNDLIITTDYEESFNSIKSAINNGTVSQEQVDRAVFRVLAWKYYKLLFSDK